MARILVVDDEPGIVALLRAALHRQGHEVITAKTCADGLAAITDDLDLLICDIRLPDGSGLDVVCGARRRHPVIRIQFITGCANLEQIGIATRYAILLKPFSLAQLFAAVQDRLAEPAA